MNNLFVFILQFILPRRVWYRRFYLRSNHWRSVRLEKLEAQSWYCDRCGTDPGFLDVHHLTYAHIWHERLQDLQVLCRDCHNGEHA